jgi:dipeptidase D
MLNLDSEDFGVITVGCAGGADSKLDLTLETVSSPKDVVFLKIHISGLRGGHSGVDAHEQRGNAIKILTRLLWKASMKYDFSLSDIKGGDKHNAIPRESNAVLAISKKSKKDFISFIQAEGKDILEEIKPIDPKMKISFEDSEDVDVVFKKEFQVKLLNLLHGLPHGVDKMSYDIPDLVETSTNLATIAVKDESVLIGLSSRSSIMSALQDFRDRIRAIGHLADAEISEGNAYPGWKPDLESNILALSKKVFLDMFGDEPKVEAIHAGLECGIIGEKFSGMDMISIGPTIKYPHSPEEQVHVSTVDKFYKYVLGILEKV